MGLDDAGAKSLNNTGLLEVNPAIVRKQKGKVNAM